MASQNRTSVASGRTPALLKKDRSKLSLPSSTRCTLLGSYTSRDRRLENESHELPAHTEVCRLVNDAQTGMLPGYPESAICVQRFDDSLNSAIHTTYRNWLRSSSMHEPRDPPLEVVTFLLRLKVVKTQVVHDRNKCVKIHNWLHKWGRSRPFKTLRATPPAWYSSQWCCQKTIGNDPSAGSPTETLLRLLLPLNDQV